MSHLKELCDYYGVFESEVKKAFTPIYSVLIDGSLAEHSRVINLMQFKAVRDEMTPS